MTCLDQQFRSPSSTPSTRRLRDDSTARTRRAWGRPPGPRRRSSARRR
jgi:hypothetical protein